MLVKHIFLDKSKNRNYKSTGTGYCYSKISGSIQFGEDNQSVF